MAATAATVEQISIKDFTSRKATATVKRNISTCPLIDLRAATFTALVRCCETRRSINQKRIRTKMNAVKAQCGVDMEPVARSFAYPACAECTMYDTLKNGRIPKQLKHVTIIRKPEEVASHG